MQAVKAELAPLQARIQESGGKDAHATAAMLALYQKYDISPMRILALPLVQLPVFFSFFLGLRRLAEAFPDAHSGGAYWFADLGACDETLMLPAASGLTALALIRLSVPGATQGMSAAEAQQAENMKMLLTGVTFISLPVASTMPASVLVFWCTNNVISLLYTGSMRSTLVRSTLSLAPLPLPRDPNAPDDPPAPASIAPVADPLAVNTAQLMAAESLLDLSETLAADGKVDEAIKMMQRAVAVREVARDNMDGSYPGEATDAQALRDALWRLAELHEQAGELDVAAAVTERWHGAGGDGAIATERAERLRRGEAAKKVDNEGGGSASSGGGDA